MTGLVTIGETQIAVIDTPGVVSRKEQSKYNTELVDSSWRALDEVDIALVTVDAVKTIGPEVRDLFVGLKKYQSNFEQNAEKTAARLKARIEDGMVDDEYTRKGFKAVLLLNKVGTILVQMVDINRLICTNQRISEMLKMGKTHIPLLHVGDTNSLSWTNYSTKCL